MIRTNLTTLIILLLLICSLRPLNGQDIICFNRLIKLGEKALKNENFDKAEDYFKAAKGCDDYNKEKEQFIEEKINASIIAEAKKRESEALRQLASEKQAVDSILKLNKELEAGKESIRLRDIKLKEKEQELEEKEQKIEEKNAAFLALSAEVAFDNNEIQHSFDLCNQALSKNSKEKRARKILEKLAYSLAHLNFSNVITYKVDSSESYLAFVEKKFNSSTLEVWNIKKKEKILESTSIAIDASIEGEGSFNESFKFSNDGFFAFLSKDGDSIKLLVNNLSTNKKEPILEISNIAPCYSFSDYPNSTFSYADSYQFNHNGFLGFISHLNNEKHSLEVVNLHSQTKVALPTIELSSSTSISLAINSSLSRSDFSNYKNSYQLSKDGFLGYIKAEKNDKTFLHIIDLNNLSNEYEPHLITHSLLSTIQFLGIRSQLKVSYSFVDSYKFNDKGFLFFLKPKGKKTTLKTINLRNPDHKYPDYQVNYSGKMKRYYTKKLGLKFFALTFYSYSNSFDISQDNFLALLNKKGWKTKLKVIDLADKITFPAYDITPSYQHKKKAKGYNYKNSFSFNDNNEALLFISSQYQLKLLNLKEKKVSLITNKLAPSHKGVDVEYFDNSYLWGPKGYFAFLIKKNNKVSLELFNLDNPTKLISEIQTSYPNPLSDYTPPFLEEDSKIASRLLRDGHIDIGFIKKNRSYQFNQQGLFSAISEKELRIVTPKQNVSQDTFRIPFFKKISTENANFTLLKNNYILLPTPQNELKILNFQDQSTFRTIRGFSDMKIDRATFLNSADFLISLSDKGSLRVTNINLSQEKVVDFYQDKAQAKK